MTAHDNNQSIPNALPVGYRFNEFEVQEAIGGGGFGIVYRAWDHQLERTIAIKEFMPSTLAVRGDDMTLILRGERCSKAFSAGLNSFIQEARLLAKFNHPNLLNVLRFWVQNDTAYMCTLFYSGTTLSRLHQQQPGSIDESWIRRVLPMLLGAVKTLHDDGYLHRDISLDNIQIQDNDVPVLLDFGSARQTIGNLADETDTMLHPGFAPIEQYTDDNESEQGPWTDIYALGAVLHTLIAGSPPPVSVVRSIQDSYLPLAERQPQGYSTVLLQAVDKALALQPADRPRSIVEFAALLGLSVAGIGDVPTAKSPGTMLVPVEEEHETPKQAAWTRHKVPGMVAAGVMVGIVTGALIFGGNSPVESFSGSKSEATATGAVNDTVAKPLATKGGEPQMAQIYIRMHDGEQLTLNGEVRSVMPAVSGFASLKLTPGRYEFILRSNGQTRSQTITVNQTGTWLLNPQR